MADYHVLVVAAPSRDRRSYVVTNAEDADEAKAVALSDPTYEPWGDEEVTVRHLSEVSTNGEELYIDAEDFR